MKGEITLRIVVQNPLAGVDFGLQKGSGSKYETIQIQRSGDKDLHFECPVSFMIKEDGRANFLGVFVQGPPAQRFIYLDIGTCAGQKETIWSRRLKIPLAGIDSKTVMALATSHSKVLEAKVPGIARDSGPNCGTVKPFTGWHIADGTIK